MAHELIRLAKSQGVHLYLDNGALKYKAKNGLSKELATALRSSKSEVIAFLQQHTKQSTSIPKKEANRLRFPLTSAQQRLFYLETLYGDKAPYNMATAFRMSGKPSIKKLENAINAIIEQHQVLKTQFQIMDGIPEQVISPDVLFTVSECPDTPSISNAVTDEEWMAEEASRPFILSEAPLFRVNTKASSNSNSTLILFVFHHIVFDGLSYRLFFNALNEYLSTGKIEQVVDYQYGDYAAWQQTEGNTALKAGEAYWFNQMKGVEELNSLTPDFPRPDTPEFSGTISRQILDKHLTATLRAFTQQQGVSLFTLLQTFFSLLIGRWTERSDVVTGTPVAGRQVSGSEQLIGFFVNTLALRFNLDDDHTFLSLLKHSKTKIAEAFRHQDVPFERIVQQLGHERRSGFSPILQVLFALHEEGEFQLDIDGIPCENVVVERSNINFELELHIMDKGEVLEATWVFADNLFHETTITSLQEALNALIQGVLADPESTIHQLPLISLKTEQTIASWNQTGKDYPLDKTFVTLFEEQVAKTPDSVACEWSNANGDVESLSYHALNEKANHLANYLIDKGVKYDQCVGLIDAWSHTSLVGILGILKSGAAYLPLDPNHPEQRLNQILSLAFVEVLLVAGSFELDRATSQSVHTMADLSQPDFWVELSSVSQSDPLVQTNPSERGIASQPDHLAYVIYTSGSTGIPKGVMVEHKNVSNFLFSLQDTVELEPTDVVASIAPPAFDIHVTEMYLPLMLGAKVVLLNWEQTRSPSSIAQCQQQHSISMMQGTPSTWQMLIDDGWQPYDGLKMLTGGDALGRQLHDKLLSSGTKARFYNLYGPTETTVYCSGNEAFLDNPRIHVGRAFPNNHYYVLDDFHQHRPIGCIGEVYLSGDNVTRGYLGQSELTTEKYRIDPFLKEKHRLYQTGDLGRWLPDGTIEIVGRKDFQVKVNGFRIELGDIEHQIRQHSDVEQSLVTAIPKSRITSTEPSIGEPQILVAYIKSQADSLELEEALKSRLDRALPRYMMPNFIVVLPEFPLTDNRKVDRRALPLPTFHLQSESKVPTSDTERSLCEIWSELLEQDIQNIEASFFSLGGHSLLAIKMISQIQEHFGVRLSLKVLFDAPTIEQMAEVLDEQLINSSEQESNGHIPIIPRAETKHVAPLSYSQQRLWALDLLEAKGRFYAVPLIYDVDENINHQALYQACLALIQRHQILQTGYQVVEGSNGASSAEQITMGEDAFQFFTEDVNEQTELNKEKALGEFERQMVDTPFELAKGEVFRVGLAKLGERKSRLFIVVHHIATDGLSLSILLNELQHYYLSFCSNHSSEDLKPLPLQYRDYAAWQREQYGHESCLRHRLEAYWEQRLKDSPEQHVLPLDFARPETPTYQGKAFKRSLGEELSANLTSAAKQHSTTLFNVIYSAFSLLLTRYSGVEEIVIGTPVANRERKELDDLVGFFVNNLPLRAKVEPSDSFESLLKRNHQHILQDFEHQSLPFEHMISLVNHRRQLNCPPIFQVMLSMEQESHETIDFGFTQAAAVSPNSTEARFDLTLGVRQSSDGVALSWNFSSDIFEQVTIESMAVSFETLISKLVAEPKSEVKTHALADWSVFDIEADNVKSDDQSTTLLALFDKQVERHPKGIALVCEEREISFERLDALANRLANMLASKGVKPEDPIAIVLDRSPEMIIAMLGVVKAGGAYVPLESNQPSQRLNKIIEDSGAQFVLTSIKLAKTTLSELPNERLIPIELESLVGECLNEQTGERISRLSSKPLPHKPLSPKQLAYIIYTSGSTGQPKGVMVEHQGVANYIQNQNEYLNLSASDISDSAGFLYLTNFAFDTSVASIWGALASGRPLHIVSEAERFDIDKLQAKLYQPERYAVAYIPPALLKELDVSGQGELIPRMVVSGEATDADLIHSLVNRTQLFNEYGPTENSVCSTVHRYEKGDAANVIGKPIAGVGYALLDDSYLPVPQGAKGRLYLSGTGVARGYVGKPELTKDKFRKLENSDAVYYDSGDVVRLNARGELEFFGRSDNQVKIRGHRVELGEIEHCISRVLGVKSAKVLAEKNDRGALVLNAYIQWDTSLKAMNSEMESTQDVSAEFLFSVRNQLEHTLPDYMIPSAWAFVDVWPLTPNGKIDQTALPSAKPIQRASHSLSSNDAAQSSSLKTRVEQVIAQVWQRLLGLENIDVNDNFFALGGDSIVAMQSVSRCSSEGVRYTVRQLFEAPTVAALADIVSIHDDNPLEGEFSYLTSSLSVSGEMPLLPVQKEFFFHAKNAESPHRFNQSILLELHQAITDEHCVSVVESLVNNHDALRLSFHLDDDNSKSENAEIWRATHQEITDEWLQQALSDIAVQSQSELAAVCDRVIDELDITQGPLFRFVKITDRFTQTTKLFVVAHHLVIDGMSWRILLDDLQALLLHPEDFRSTKTLSFSAWSQRNLEWITGDTGTKTIPYWRKVEASIKARFSSSQAPVMAHIELDIGASQTLKLTQSAHRAYGTNTQDILLVALLLSLGCGTEFGEDKIEEGGNVGKRKNTSLSIALETHGRHAEHLCLNGKNADLSETVGWFTSIYPMNLSGNGAQISDLICSIKEQVRSVPDKGVGYSWLKSYTDSLDKNAAQPDILFNFLGQFGGDTAPDSIEKKQTAFSVVSGFRVEDGAKGHMTPRAMAFNCRVRNGVLSFDLDYDTGCLSHEQVSAFSVQFQKRLTQIIDHCVEQETTRRTPSDFRAPDLHQVDIDSWDAAHKNASLSLIDVYPATGMQQGLLFHSELEKDAYVTQLTLTLDNVDPDILKLAWQAVINRHDILKTSFALSEEGARYQRVAKEGILRWQQTNLTSLGEGNGCDAQNSSGELKDKVDVISHQEKWEGFDVSSPTLTKFHWIQLSKGQGKLIWSTHHALLDGWCLPIIVSELRACYAACENASTLALPPAKPYRRYIDWLQNQDHQLARQYWRDQLSRFEEPTPLPLKSFSEHANESLGANKGDQRFKTLPLSLSSQQTQGLERLARESGCTLNTVLQGAWALLLSTYSGCEQVVFGSTVSGRPASLAGSETMVGLFINTVPVVVDVDLSASLNLWLQKLHVQNAQSEEFSFLPLFEIQAQAGSASQALFDSILVVENYPVSDEARNAQHDGSWQISAVESVEHTNYGISLQAYKSTSTANENNKTSQLELSATYDCSKFTDWQMRQLVTHLENVLYAFASNSRSALRDIPMLGEQEQHYLLRELNNTQTETPTQSIHGWVEHFAASTPNKTALVEGDRHWTYHELNLAADRIAHHLQSKGIQENDRVGVCVERSAEMVLAVLAVLKLGALYVPMDAKYPRERIELLVSLSETQCILTDGKAEFLSSNSRYHVIDISPQQMNKWEQPSRFCSVKRDLGDSAMVIFTSGSTGQPKGVEVPHSGVVRLLKNTNFVSITPETTVGQVSNFSFDASSFDIWGALINGATVVVLKDDEVQDVNRLSEQISTHNIKVFCMATALMNQLVELKPNLFANVEYLLFGGEAVNGKTIESIFEYGKPKHLVNVYGPAENSTICSTYEITELRSDYPMGRATANSTAYVLNHRQQLVPLGQMGELYVGGKGLAKGYFGRSDLTAERFVHQQLGTNHIERLYRTGDLVRYNQEGQLEFISRVDHQVKIRGQRLELSEVQLRILASDSVEAAYVGTLSRGTEKQLYAVVQFANAEDSETKLAQLKEILGSILPNFMVPTLWVTVEEMPLTPNGKVDAKSLATLVENSNQKQVNTGAPRDDVEMALYRIWREILLEKEIGIRDNFFDVGGSSIAAIKVMHFIDKQFAVRIPVSELINHPTIEALGGLVRAEVSNQCQLSNQRQPSSNWPHGVIEFRPSQNGKNVICIHPAGGTAFGYLSFAKAMPEEYGVYGIQAKGVDTDEDFLPDVQAMAHYYLDQVKSLLDKPHVFVGASYGGIVSFEMARVMKTRGCSFSTAVVLDSEATENRAALAKIQPVSNEVFRQKLVTYNGMYPGIKDQQIERYHRLYNHHLDTLKKLTLDVSSAPTILVLATDDKDEEHLQLMRDFWSAKVAATLQVETIQGDHSTLLEPPYIDSVARMIEKELSHD